VTNGEREKRESVVAVVDGSDVLVVAGPAGPSLPQLDDGFPSPAQVFDAAGVGPEFAVIAAPTRHVDGTPAQIGDEPRRGPRLAGLRTDRDLHADLRVPSSIRC